MMNLTHPHFNPLLWQGPRFIPHPTTVHPAFLHAPHGLDTPGLDPRVTLGMLSDTRKLHGKPASFTIDSILGHEQRKPTLEKGNVGENNNYHNFNELEGNFEATQLKQRVKKRKILRHEDTVGLVSGRRSEGSVRLLLQNSTVNERSSLCESGVGCKGKRVRTIFTPEQLERLEAIFQKQQYMVGTERYYLALSLQLSEAQVKVWFQNRRIKWRKQQFEAEHRRLSHSDMFNTDSALLNMSPDTTHGEMSPPLNGAFPLAVSAAMDLNNEKLQNGIAERVLNMHVSSAMDLHHESERSSQIMHNMHISSGTGPEYQSKREIEYTRNMQISPAMTLNYRREDEARMNPSPTTPLNVEQEDGPQNLFQMPVHLKRIDNRSDKSDMHVPLAIPLNRNENENSNASKMHVLFEGN